VDLLRDEAIDTIELVSRTSLPDVRSDPWTAIVFLFHDHDWEEALLPQALRLPALYFGAVGSKRTHHARLAMLQAAGVPEPFYRALRGPVGLIPATRDPATLALSILAEVVQEYQRIASHQPQEQVLVHS
jgi:xanthine dehydrogenase accessory factor